MTSDARALLLREADRAIGLIAACFRDGRDPERVVHVLRTLIGQRIIGLALGYEDVADHDDLRFDPVLALFSDRLEPRRPDRAQLGGSYAGFWVTASNRRRVAHMPTATTATATDASSGVIEEDGAGQPSNQERRSSGPADRVHL